MSCSHDTNGDGNCGRPNCPECGSKIPKPTEHPKRSYELLRCSYEMIDEMPIPEHWSHEQRARHERLLIELREFIDTEIHKAIFGSTLTTTPLQPTTYLSYENSIPRHPKATFLHKFYPHGVPRLGLSWDMCLLCNAPKADPIHSDSGYDLETEYRFLTTCSN